MPHTYYFFRLQWAWTRQLALRRQEVSWEAGAAAGPQLTCPWGRDKMGQRDGPGRGWAVTPGPPRCSWGQLPGVGPPVEGSAGPTVGGPLPGLAGPWPPAHPGSRLIHPACWWEMQVGGSPQLCEAGPGPLPASADPAWSRAAVLSHRAQQRDAHLPATGPLLPEGRPHQTTSATQGDLHRVQPSWRPWGCPRSRGPGLGAVGG